MALRCTVFGHRWGDAAVERDRQEDGDEVVVTVREVRTCGRCGAEDVLGESMEVTAIDRNEADTARSGRASPDRDVEPDDGDDYDSATDDGVILDDEGGAGERSPREWPDRPEHEQVDDGGDPGPWPETARPDDETPPEDRFVGPDDDPEAGGPPEEHAERDRDDGPPAADDARRSSGHRDDEPAGGDDGGEIIDAGSDEGRAGDDGDDPDRVDVPQAEPDAGGGAGSGASGGDEDRGPGAAGDEGDTTPDEPPAMGPDATQRPDDDAEVLEATDPNEQSRATAAEPVDPADTAPREEPADDPRRAGGGDREDVSLDPSEPPSDERAPEDVEYYCPECGFLDDSDWPSRRAGDICPDCRRSYLAEREV